MSPDSHKQTGIRLCLLTIFSFHYLFEIGSTRCHMKNVRTVRWFGKHCQSRSAFDAMLIHLHHHALSRYRVLKHTDSFHCELVEQSCLDLRMENEDRYCRIKYVAC